MRIESERDIHSCCVCWGGWQDCVPDEILFGKLCEVPSWARANLQALIAVVFSLCHLALFYLNKESVQKQSSFISILCNAEFLVVVSQGDPASR